MLDYVYEWHVVKHIDYPIQTGTIATNQNVEYESRVCRETILVTQKLSERVVTSS